MSALRRLTSVCAALAAAGVASAEPAAPAPARLSVYNFFATWCAPCRQEMPHLARLWKQYRDRGLRLVLVSVDSPSTAPQVPAFLARFDMDGAEVVYDADSELAERYNTTASIPYTVVVDASGRTLYRHAGYQPGDELRLQTALESAAPPAEATPPRLTVYNFFASWCLPCGREMPHLARLSKQFRDVRFVLVAADSPSTAPQVPAFLARFGMDGGEVVYDAGSELAERYNATASMPYTLVLDASGRTLYRHAGYEPGDELRLEAALLSARGSPTVAGPHRPDSVSATLQSVGLSRSDDFRSRADPTARGTIDRLSVAGGYGALRASVRLDGTLLTVNGAPDRDLRAEKLSLGATLGRVRLLAGDGYAAFGHGLTLSVRKVDPIGLDTTVRGGRVDVALGGFGATALAGVFNPQNTDPIELRTLPDPQDRVAGLELRERVSPTLSLSQSAVASRLRGAAPDGADVDCLAVGVAADARGARARGAFDAVVLSRRGLAAGGVRETGHGLYASASVDLGAWTPLIEAKWYRRLGIGRKVPTFAYSEAPTLEREDQLPPSDSDAAGGRLRLEWRSSARTTAHANVVAYRYSTDGSDPIHGGWVAHAYAGVDYRSGSGAQASGSLGYRQETLPDGSDKLELIQGVVDASVPLGRNLALTGRWDHRFETKWLFLGPRSFVVGYPYLGVSWKGRVVVSYLSGYSTEAPEARPVYYPGVEAKVTFRNYGDVRLFAGRLAGGRVCVSGVCREVPPFQGVRLDLALRL